MSRPSIPTGMEGGNRAMRLSLKVIVLVLFLVAGFSCNRTESAKPLKVGIDQFAGFAPIYLAKDRRIYQDLGIQVEPKIITNTVERNSAFASGDIDALCTTADSLLLAAEKGLDLVIIGAVDESAG